jgi:ABC-type sugar transport system substrate-binding protein
MKKRIVMLIACVLLTLFVTGMVMAKGTQESKPSEEYRYTMIIYGTTGNPFWKKVVTGAEEAAEKLDVDVDVQYA